MQNVRQYARRVLPVRVLRWYSVRQARRQLRHVIPVSCEPAALSSADQFDPEEVFCSSRYHQAWQRVERDIATLRITHEAGGVNPGDRRAIYYLVCHFAPRSVLEIGTHIGASTVHIAAALRDLQGECPSHGRRLTTVDVRDVNDPRLALWKRLGSTYAPREMMRALHCDDLVRFVTSRSVDYLGACKEQFDLVFLDGNHSAAGVYQEIAGALRLLRAGGWVLLHDCFPELKPLWSPGHVVPGPWLAAERLKREGAPLSVIPLGKLPWPTKLGSQVTSLALLGKTPLDKATQPVEPVIHPLVRPASGQADLRRARGA